MLHLKGNILQQVNTQTERCIRFIQKKNLKASRRLSFLALFSMIILSQIVSPSVAFGESINNVNSSQASGSKYILSKSLIWPDGTKEQIDLDQDHFFYLDGVKRKLIGVVLQTTSGPPYGQSGEFYLQQNLALYDKELAYLESVGVRIVHVDLRYMRFWAPSIADEEAAYTKLLDLIEKHKMLVIPEISGKSIPGFNSLKNPDFSWAMSDGEDSMGRWANRWAEIVSRYQNVVAVVVENELDYPLTAAEMTWNPKATDQNYGTAEISNYIGYIKNIIRAKMNVPIIHKLIGDTYANLDTKLAAIEATDFPSFDVYNPTVKGMNLQLDKLLQWLKKSGYNQTGWWAMEFGAGWDPVVMKNLNTALIESAFSHGATIVMLFPSNLHEQPSWQLFNDDGTPVSTLVSIAKDFNRLQAPIAEQINVAANIKLNSNGSH